MNRLPQTSINGNCSIDEELIEYTATHHEFQKIIESEEYTQDLTVYKEIVKRIAFLEAPDIELIINTYFNTPEWEQLGEKPEFIDECLKTVEQNEKYTTKNTQLQTKTTYTLADFDKALEIATVGTKRENLEKAEWLISTFLINHPRSTIEKLIVTDIKDRFKFNREEINILKKVLKEKMIESGYEQETGPDGIFDLDTVTGRNHIYRTFADEYIKTHNVKCINGKLRKYVDGVYPESDENVDFIKSEIMQIGLSHKVNLADNNINAVLKLIENSTRVKLEECEPRNDSVLVVNNGILNTKTWELEEFSTEKVYFSKIPVDYDQNAKIPEIFLRYVETVFKGNEDQKDLFQEMFGYTLCKNYKYQVMFYLLGPGGNGKGIALSLLRYILGDHNVSAESLFQLTDHLNVDYHIAKLYGKHVNICGDISCKKVDNTENLKKLTSNTDPVTARHVKERPFVFLNYAKIIVAMNRLPETDAFTTGDKRRNVIISFNNKFVETSGEIHALQDVIRDSGELPGVLLWAIEGLKRLEVNQRFSDKRTIAQRANEYEKKSRPVQYFVEERLEESVLNILPNIFLNEDFSRFCKKSGATELSDREIKKLILRECFEAGWEVRNKLIRVNILPCPVQDALKAAGVRAKYLRCYMGIKIVDPEPEQTIISEYTLQGDVQESKESVKNLLVTSDPEKALKFLEDEIV